MEPLDLRTRAPRPCRAELGGIAFLPRAIDKARATLPDGHLGTYIVLDGEISTMSGLFYRRLGFTNDEFVAAVARAASDDDVLAWVRERVDGERVAKWHRQFFGIRLGDIPEANRARVTAYYPPSATLPPETLLVDVIDADDAHAFAAANG